MAWYSTVYTNEVFFFFPGFLWFTVRTHILQRVVDILRTIPLASLAVVYLVTGKASMLFQVVVFSSAAVLNVFMYVADRALAPAVFDTATYAFSQLSLINWLTGRAASNKWVRMFCVGINVVAGLYFAFAMFVAFPISQAFMCYASRDPATFTEGYCPQYTGVYPSSTTVPKLPSPCDINVGDQVVSPRCNPHLFGEYTSMHDTLSAAGHVSGTALLVSATIHCAQILPAAEAARVRSCLEAANLT